MSGSSTDLNELEWDNKLPDRLFATDRFPVARLNVYSKIDYISAVYKCLKDTLEFEIIRSSPFGQLFDFPVRRCSVACKLIHALMCRQLVTKKKYELWFVYGGQPLRFSLVEFASITGLNCSEFPEDYSFEDQSIVSGHRSSYWNQLIGEDKQATLADLQAMLESEVDMPGWRKLGIALILLLDGVLIAKHQTGRPTPKYVEMLADVDSFLKFPWGRESFLRTINSMKPCRKPSTVGKDNVEQFRNALQQQTRSVFGFPLALQLLALQQVPLLLSKIPDYSDNRTFLDLQRSNKSTFTLLTLHDVLSVENDQNLVVYPLIEADLIDQEQCIEWEDEVKDRKVDYLVDLISKNHVFKKAMWPRGDSSLPLYIHDQQIASPVSQRQRTRTARTPVAKQTKRKRKAGVQSTKQSSKRKQRRVDQYFKPAEQQNVITQALFEEKLAEIRAEFREEIQMLKDQIHRLSKPSRITSFGSKFSARRLSKKKRPISERRKTATFENTMPNTASSYGGQQDETRAPRDQSDTSHNFVSKMDCDNGSNNENQTDPENSTHQPRGGNIKHTEADVLGNSVQQDGLPTDVVSEGLSRNAFPNSDPASSVVATVLEDIAKGMSGHEEIVSEMAASHNVSSAPRKSDGHKQSQLVIMLADRLSSEPSRCSNHLFHKVDTSLFTLFKETLEESPDLEHITSNNLTFTNKSLLDLATPRSVFSKKHSEVLMSFLGKVHAEALSSERAVFMQPWLTAHLDDKYRKFKCAHEKELVHFDDALVQLICAEGAEWITDVDIIYVPMLWEQSHWVGLVINLKLWVVEILDPKISLYSDKQVESFIAPVVQILPYLINKYCKAELSQSFGSQSFHYYRVSDVYETECRKESGPVCIKFMEMHANGLSSFSYITAEEVEEFRKQYAMHIWDQLILPLYFP